MDLVGVTILILLLHIEKYVVVIRKNQMIIHLNQGVGVAQWVSLERLDRPFSWTKSLYFFFVLRNVYFFFVLFSFKFLIILRQPWSRLKQRNRQFFRRNNKRSQYLWVDENVGECSDDSNEIRLYTSIVLTFVNKTWKFTSLDNF